MVLPALLAGGLVAFVQTLTQFGVPAILALPAGLPRHHDEDLGAVPVSRRSRISPRPRRCRCWSLTILLLQGQQLLLGRRGYTAIGGRSSAPRPVRLGAWRWPALAFALALLSLPILLPYAALIKTAIVRTPSDPLTSAR